MPRRPRNTDNGEKKEPSILEDVIPLTEFLATRDRLCASVHAETGEGKSFFPLNWPKPMQYITLETDGPQWAFHTAIELGIMKASEVNVIEPIRYAFKGDAPPEMVWTEDEEWTIYNYTKDVINALIDNRGDEGTLVLDTAQTFYTIVRVCEMEEIIEKRSKQKKDLFRYDYGVATKAFRQILMGIRQRSNLNLVLTSQSTQVYNSKGQVTKKWQYGGTNIIPEIADIHGKLIHDPSDDYEPEDPRNWVYAVEKCRINPAKVGEEVENPTFKRLFDLSKS